MRDVHPLIRGVGLLWLLVLLLALALSGEASAAGTLSGPIVGITMALSIAFAIGVAVAAWSLPTTMPLIVRRLLAIGGMAGAFWGMGTVVRGLSGILS